jgi:hypothetical protein
MNAQTRIGRIKPWWLDLEFLALWQHGTAGDLELPSAPKVLLYQAFLLKSLALYLCF